MTEKTALRMLVVLVMLLIASEPERSLADITMISRSVTKMPRGVSEDGLETVVYLKGPWMRRETRGGAGMLASVLGEKTTIVNRVTAETLSLYPEEKKYEIDTLGSVSCGLEDMVDLSWLGVNRGRLSATLSFPDSEMTICDCTLQPVQIEMTPKGLTYAGRTTLRLWMCSDYQSTFGPSFLDDLFCGQTPDDSASLDHMSKSWQEQLGLSDTDANEVRLRVRGIPFLMESFSWRDITVLNTTSITMTSVKTEALHDSLFAPPGGYERRDTAHSTEGGR